MSNTILPGDYTASAAARARAKVLGLKPIRFTQHALDTLRDRAIERAWAEAAVRNPDWVEPDVISQDVERRFRRTLKAGGRVLRVPVVETDAEIRVIIVMFDRNARRRK